MPHSSRYTTILGEPVLKRTVYLVILAILIVVVGGLGLLYSMILKNRGAVGVDTSHVNVPAELPGRVAATPASSPVEAELPVTRSKLEKPKAVSVGSPLVRLLESHIEVTGFGELDTFILRGTTMANAQEYEVTLMARRSNLYKLKTLSDRLGFMTQFAYDGQSGSFEATDPTDSTEIIEFFMHVALLESSLAHLAWSYQSEEAVLLGLDSVLERLPEERMKGRDCAVVMSRALLPFPMYHYIDLETYEEVYRRAKIPRGAELVDVELHFASSDAEAAFRLPLGYELYIDGALHDSVSYTKVRANQTMLSSLFDAPADAPATGLAPRL